MSLRVAVHPGTATTRVAVADPKPRLVAELPGYVTAEAAVVLLFARPVAPTVVGPGGTPVGVAVSGAPRRLVVDAGASRVEVSVVDGGRVVATRQVALGEMCAQVVGLAREHPVGEVVLVGGRARDPRLAALLDSADLPPVRVPAGPDSAAVLGAVAVAAPSADSAVDVPGRLLPVPRRRRASVVAAAVVAVAVLGVGTAGVVPTLSRHADDTGPESLVQYGYRFVLPAGWAHTGGLPERRRTLVTPAAAPDGVELMAVERTDLAYDATLEPARAAADLRARYDDSVAAGGRLDGFAPGRAGERDVHTYRQTTVDGRVDWTVVLDGTAQLSVGCRHGPVASASLLAACAEVVASVTPA
ncbi:type VII secretion-associated protein [Pseudonocardia sp. N23]|uniref:type VII secretion-associated protein n=1 Tax=Pseudonocardia sp. N23 TaxID=1987376 RepID=UPI000BFC7BBA|nr:type VII secretion-associated protein [Pseudonocardia sp. N23]GAY10163.1 molecular chaperone [Pseudonocardia sp. N23]